MFAFLMPNSLSFDTAKLKVSIIETFLKRIEVGMPYAEGEPTLYP